MLYQKESFRGVYLDNLFKKMFFTNFNPKNMTNIGSTIAKRTQLSHPDAGTLFNLKFSEKPDLEKLLFWQKNYITCSILLGPK